MGKNINLIEIQEKLGLRKKAAVKQSKGAIAKKYFKVVGNELKRKFKNSFRPKDRQIPMPDYFGRGRGRVKAQGTRPVKTVATAMTRAKGAAE